MTSPAGHALSSWVTRAHVRCHDREPGTYGPDDKGCRAGCTSICGWAVDPDSFIDEARGHARRMHHKLRHPGPVESCRARGDVICRAAYPPPCPLHGLPESPISDTLLPLYEAKMLHHYDAAWATYEADGSTRHMTEAEKASGAAPLPRYWVSSAVTERRINGGPIKGSVGQPVVHDDGLVAVDGKPVAWLGETGPARWGWVLSDSATEPRGSVGVGGWACSSCALDRLAEWLRTGLPASRFEAWVTP